MNRINSLFFCPSRLLQCRTLAGMLQLMLAAIVLNVNIARVCGNGTPEMGPILDPEAANDANALMLGYDASKRSWQSLQGSWGKRSTSGGSADTSAADADAEAVYLAEQWMPLLINNDIGERGFDSPTPKYSVVYLTNAAVLDRLANQQRHAEEEAARLGDTDLSTNSLENLDGADNMLNEKRAWKSMNVAWGKRRNAPAWNKFRGAWGKREPGWNNLKGMWGKRSSKDWQKLHSGWGKRADIMN